MVSQAADAAELSKARIVQVVAYCRRASQHGGQLVLPLASLRVCACTCPGVSEAKWGQERAADKNAEPRAFRDCGQALALAGDRRRPEGPRRGRASRQTARQVAFRMSLADRRIAACHMLSVCQLRA
jgi:hypothetical protein